METLQKILLSLKGNEINKIWFKVLSYFSFIAPNVPNDVINN